MLASEDCDVLGVTTEMKQSVVCWWEKPVGEPDAGNPHVRFDDPVHRERSQRSGVIWGNWSVKPRHWWARTV